MTVAVVERPFVSYTSSASRVVVVPGRYTPKHFDPQPRPTTLDAIPVPALAAQPHAARYTSTVVIRWMLPIVALGWLSLVYVIATQLPTFTGPAHTWLAVGYFLTLAETLALTFVSFFPDYVLDDSYRTAHLETIE
jgi:hypothetical protein